MDRIDIHIDVPAVKYRDLASREAGESSREIKKRIDSARRIQIERFKGMKIYNFNPSSFRSIDQIVDKICNSSDAFQFLVYIGNYKKPL